MVEADAEQVTHHARRLSGEVDARLVVLNQRERDLADTVAGAARQKEYLGVEREPVQALTQEEILRGFGGVRLAAALRVLHAGRHQRADASAEPASHETPPPRSPDDRSGHVARRDRDIGALVDRAY